MRDQTLKRTAEDIRYGQFQAKIEPPKPIEGETMNEENPETQTQEQQNKKLLSARATWT